MRVILIIAVVVFAIVLAPPADADTVISFGLEVGQPRFESLNGTSVYVADLVTTAGVLIFDAPLALQSPVEDVNAGHVRANGDVLLSFSTWVFNFGGLAQIQPGDVILWDGSTSTATEIFDGGPIPGVDAVYETDDGDLILSFNASGTLDGTAFSSADLVLWDMNPPPPPAIGPAPSRASIWFDGDTGLTGTAGQKDIDAVHVVSDTSFIFSTLVSIIGTREAYSLYMWNNGTITQYLDGSALFDGSVARQLDAASMTASNQNQNQNQGPEPTTFMLAGLALLVALSLRHRL